MSTARLPGALLGLVSAGSGLAASELASGYLHQRVSPVVAVAESVIGLTPGAVIEFVISIVGRNDKPLLIGVVLLGLAVTSAAVGILALRSTGAAIAAFSAMGVVLVLAVHDRLTPSQATYIPAVLGIGAAMGVLMTMLPTARKAAAREANGLPSSEASAASSRSRREFLRTAGLVGMGALVVGATGRVLAHGRAAVDAARRHLKLNVTGRSAPPGTELSVDGITGWVTPQDDFYRIDTALSVPQILPANWSLRIHGMVDHELTLSYDDLIGRGLTEAWLTLCCVSNEVGGNLISNAWWSGVLLAPILHEAGIRDGADAVLSRSDDGWTCGTPIEALTDDRNAMLAVAMNGEPLTPEHGFPVRMVVPGLYGYVSATKWVVDLEVTRFADFSAFWTQRGWSAQGPIKTESRIDVPHNGATVKAGDVAIAGIAWAQHLGVETVEVRVDDEAWVEAELGKDASIDSWRQWAHVWAAEAGEHTIQVRATDASGAQQTSEQVGVLPDGATGWHTIHVKVT